MHACRAQNLRRPIPGYNQHAAWLGMLNFRETRVWKRLQANGMAEDFSWERSAREYDVVYQRALNA